jgi:hypothetical protein
VVQILPLNATDAMALFLYRRPGSGLGGLALFPRQVWMNPHIGSVSASIKASFDYVWGF